MKNRLIAFFALALLSLSACADHQPGGDQPGKAQHSPAQSDTMPRDNMGHGSSPGGGGQ